MEKSQTYLAFDFGLKRVGVAVGQDVTKTASPLTTLQAKNGKPNWDDVTALIAEWSPVALIVGIPSAADNADLPTTALAKKFAAQLHNRFELPVYHVDEHLTTKNAREEVYQQRGYKALRSTEIDAVAAALILETWFAS